MALVEIALFPTRSEAEVAAATLRAFGMDAHLFDDVLGQAYRSPLSGGKGFAVMAPEEVRDEARALLETMRETPAADDEE